MAYHGLCYSHSGLVDTAIMPAYVAKAKWLHEKAMDWTTLDQVLPKWSSLSTWLTGVQWDLGHEMQGRARPDGAARLMVYKAKSNTWVPKPRVVKEETTKGKKTSSRRGRDEEKSKAKKTCDGSFQGCEGRDHPVLPFLVFLVFPWVFG